MPRRRQEEMAIQKLVFAHIAARSYPDVIAWHTPLGGYRRRIEAAILKGAGVKPGIPDICALYRRRFYALELKAPGGRVTETQGAMLIALERAGAVVGVADSLDRALGYLETWGLLRRAV